MGKKKQIKNKNETKKQNHFLQLFLYISMTIIDSKKNEMERKKTQNKCEEKAICKNGNEQRNEQRTKNKDRRTTNEKKEKSFSRNKLRCKNLSSTHLSSEGTWQTTLM